MGYMCEPSLLRLPYLKIRNTWLHGGLIWTKFRIFCLRCIKIIWSIEKVFWLKKIVFQIGYYLNIIFLRKQVQYMLLSKLKRTYPFTLLTGRKPSASSSSYFLPKMSNEPLGLTAKNCILESFYIYFDTSLHIALLSCAQLGSDWTSGLPFGLWIESLAQMRPVFVQILLKLF